jgi:hypothetical protein
MRLRDKTRSLPCTFTILLYPRAPELAPTLLTEYRQFSVAIHDIHGAAQHQVEDVPVVRGTALLHRASAAEIGLSRNDSGSFVLSAALAVTVAGVDQQMAGQLVEVAHAICPYSNAIKGNVDVQIDVSVR